MIEQVQLDSDENLERIHLELNANHENLRNSLYAGDAYMLGIRNDIVERLWVSRG